jgi:hypothetical protein
MGRAGSRTSPVFVASKTKRSMSAVLLQLIHWMGRAFVLLVDIHQLRFDRIVRTICTPRD